MRVYCAAIKREEQERKREREHVIQTELVDDPVAPAEDDDHHNAIVLPSDVSDVLISNGVFLLSTGCSGVSWETNLYRSLSRARDRSLKIHLRRRLSRHLDLLLRIQ